jgi:hypothetical protein
MRGYSQIVMEANENAIPSLGVTLGAICISQKYPVTKIAKRRQAVYDWFSGKAKPAKDKEEIINKIIAELTIEE